MSGTLNPLIYALSNKPAVQLQSPLETLGQAAGTVNALNQNRLFQGRMAVGNALQQATDPTTGQLDPLSFNKLVAANPNAAIAMSEAANQSQALQGQQQALQQSRSQVIGSMLGSVLNAPDDQLHDVAASTLGRAVTMGLVPQAQATAFALKLPNDPTALRSTLDQMQKSLLAPSDQRAQTYGVPTTLDNGQNVISGVTAPASQGGGFAPGSAVPVYPSRGSLSELVPVTGADGVQRMVLRGTLVNQGGGGGLTGPAGAGLGGNGRYPSQQGASASPEGAPVSPGSNVLDANKADFDAFDSDRKTLGTHETNVQTLQLARQNLASAKTGAGAGGLQSVLSVINTFSPDAAKRIGAMTGTDVEKYDEAKKLLTDYSRSSGAATHSDAQLAAAQGSNPSVYISNQAAQDIASLQIGRERQSIARAQLAPDQRTGLGYQQHASSFASSTDPRGFAWDTYTPEQQQNILKSVGDNKVARTRLVRSIGIAADRGWVQPPSAPSSAPVAAPAPVAAASPARPPPDVPTGY